MVIAKDKDASTNIRLLDFDKRIHEIDFIRGLLIVIVLLDHIFNQLYKYGQRWCGGTGIFANGFFEWYWYGGESAPGVFMPTHTPRTYLQPIVIAVFCFISGISSAFSRNNWKRAIETLFVWAIVFLSTNLLQIIILKDGGNTYCSVDFNIIGVLGFSILAYCFVQNRSWKISLVIALFGLLMFFFFIPGFAEFMKAKYGVFSTPRAELINEVPDFYLPFLWMPHKYNVPPADYVPLFPYISFFFFGVVASRFLYKEKKSLLPRYEFERPLCFLGRNTLTIYITHMPIVLILFKVLDLIIMGGK